VCSVQRRHPHRAIPAGVAEELLPVEPDPLPRALSVEAVDGEVAANRGLAVMAVPLDRSALGFPVLLRVTIRVPTWYG
jgi:hypothetical protein